MVTIKDVAREAGVAISTVSNVFNNAEQLPDAAKRFDESTGTLKGSLHRAEHLKPTTTVDEETGEKTVGTDERIARRILEEYPELMNEVSIAFDGMIVDLNRQFPSLACELSMLFQILLFVLITFTIIIMFIQNLHSYQKQTIKNK